MTESLEQIVRELKDRQDIYDCIMRYCRGVDRFDRELLASAYHPDALDDHGEYVGPVEGFIDWAFAWHSKYQQRTQHTITNHICELDGDAAHTESYWTYHSVNREAPFQSQTSGRYIDRLERRDGRWAIAARVCLIDVADAGIDPNGDAGDIRFEKTARDRTDPSYRRPLVVDPARLTQ